MNYLGWMFAVAILIGNIMYTDSTNKELMEISKDNVELVKIVKDVTKDAEKKDAEIYARGVNDAKLAIMSLNHTNKCKAMQSDVDSVTDKLIKNGK